MRINLQTMQEYLDKGLISARKHPTKDLHVLNYTKECQHAGAWDDFTMMCRGLVIRGDGEIVARPFKKFFNLGERPETSAEILSIDEHTIFQEKMDGWLLVVFRDPADNRIECCTRGSFESDGVPVAKKIIKRDFDEGDPMVIGLGLTYCFELVSPETKIVVDYDGGTFLSLLAVFQTETGRDLGPDLIPSMASRLRCKYAKFRMFKSLDDMKTFLDTAENFEGFVVVFRDGFRVKAKSSDYVRLHRLVTGWTEKKIWEAMRDGVDLEPLLKDAPEEFAAWARGIFEGLRKEYGRIFQSSLSRAQHASLMNTRKKMADYIRRGEYPQVAFTLLDKHDPSEVIWRLLKPKGE